MRAAQPQQSYISYRALVGRVVATHRARNGLPQGELAKHLGITQATLSRLENGQIGFTAEQLAVAAAALKTTPSALLAEADHAVPMLRAQGYKIVLRAEETKSDWVPVAGGVLAAILVAIALGGKR